MCDWPNAAGCRHWLEIPFPALAPKSWAHDQSGWTDCGRGASRPFWSWLHLGYDPISFSLEYPRPSDVRNKRVALPPSFSSVAIAEGEDGVYRIVSAIPGLGCLHPHPFSQEKSSWLTHILSHGRWLVSISVALLRD